MKIKSLIILVGMLCCIDSISQFDKLLVKHFTSEQLEEANTAKNSSYLAQNEIESIQYLNLARVFPKEFSNFYLDYLMTMDPNGFRLFKRHDKYYYGLYKDLQELENGALNALEPCIELHQYAECWAKESGRRGVTGHKRAECSKSNFGECCSYMSNQIAMEHILLLLIDEDISSLGHRKLMLSNIKSVGASFQPHKEYGYVLVMDFRICDPVEMNTAKSSLN